MQIWIWPTSWPTFLLLVQKCSGRLPKTQETKAPLEQLYPSLERIGVEFDLEVVGVGVEDVLYLQ